MKPFLTFLTRRLLAIPVSFVIITMILFAGVMLTPPQARAELYFPPTGAHLTEEQIQRIIDNIIVKYHLNAPYPVQYVYWVKSLFENQWGYSPMMNNNVLPALVERTPATAELTLYSLLFFIPLGLVSGVASGWKQHSASDNSFRFIAFIATSFPPFILAILFLAIFYVKLGWFAPGRIDLMLSFEISGTNFHSYTGMLTVDLLLNGRMDIFISAVRHLVMPVVTLSLFHWATLGRITRATIGAERHKEYITAAKSRGLTDQRVLWRHVFWNTIAPSFTSMALSAASLITGVFVVEIIYNIRGVSDVMVQSMQMVPDAPAALGFSLYCILIVMLLMFVLDICQAIFDPRIREDIFKMKSILRKYFSHARNWLALFLVLFFIVIAVAAPFFSPLDPNNPGNYKTIGRVTVVEPQPPGDGAPLGTLSRGTSVYHSLIWGTRDALSFGLIVTLCVAATGIVYGAVAGYAGGGVNRVMMRVSDAFLTFPVIASIVFLAQLRLNVINSVGGEFGVIMSQYPTYQIPTQNILQMIVVHMDALVVSLIIFSWMPYARLVNALVISLKQTEFVVAAHSIGAKPSRILFRHILPNAVSPALVLAARDVGSFVIFKATLTFIGMGGNSVWGAILFNSRDWIIGQSGNVLTYWWTFIPATLVVILFGIAWNLFGDGLAELMDPFTRYQKG